MAKKRSGALKKMRERAVSKRTFLANPPDAKNLIVEVVPAFAGYGAGRMANRVAMRTLAPRIGKHAGPLASAVVFGASWYLAHHWSVAKKYQAPLVIGAGLAFLQSVLQTYVPQVGWVVGDYSPEQYAPVAPAASSATSGLPDIDDDFVYDDAGPQSHASLPPGANATGGAPPINAGADLQDAPIADIDSIDLGSLGGGMGGSDLGIGTGIGTQAFA